MGGALRHQKDSCYGQRDQDVWADHDDDDDDDEEEDLLGVKQKSHLPSCLHRKSLLIE